MNFTEFKESRSKWHTVNFRWVWSKAQKTEKERTGNENATVKKHVITTFLKKRRIQRSKSYQKEHYREAIMRWHSTLRYRGIHTSAGHPGYNPKWGRFLPRQHTNHPCPLQEMKIEKGDKENCQLKTWGALPQASHSKQFCTFNVCTQPEGVQLRLAIILRDQALWISEVEKMSWDNDIDVYFQSKPWANSNFCLEWAKRTLVSVLEMETGILLFLDNLR